jgi:hypothetical protein
MAINGEKPESRGRGNGYDVGAPAVTAGSDDPRCTRTIDPADPMRIVASRVAPPGSLIASRVAQSKTKPIKAR